MLAAIEFFHTFLICCDTLGTIFLYLFPRTLFFAALLNKFLSNEMINPPRNDATLHRHEAHRIILRKQKQKKKHKEKC